MFQCLSPISVKLLRDVLRNALDQAVKWGFVVRNVVLLVDPPKVEQRDITTLPPEQGQQLLDAAKGDRLEALRRVALFLGLHEREVLGLRWQDVDLEQGTLRIVVALPLVKGKLVVVKPKTTRSQRTLALPSTLVTALRARRIRRLEDWLVAGSR